jgi:uncharacterized protein (TIGR03083 family)
MCEMSANTELLTALWSSHRRLDDATRSLTDEQIAGPSYCRDWSTAQVLSHIGSGAQIFELFLEAGLASAETPGGEEFSKIWDVWNSMGPTEQARHSLIADAAFLQRVEAVSAEQLDSLQMNIGIPADATMLLGLRLAEHAIHTWDVMVIRDPAVEVAGDAVARMVDRLDQVAARSGKTEGGPLEVDITTTDPGRRFRLSVSDAVMLTPSGTSAAPEAGTSTAKARMPAAALVRLVYGRLDPEHTPAAVETDGVDLESLRSVFPGP